MISQGTSHNKYFSRSGDHSWFTTPLLIAALLVGCDGRNERANQNSGSDVGKAAPESGIKKPRPLATAGPHKVEVAEFVSAVSEARALRHWKTGRPAAIAALKNPKFRRKLLIRSLETRIVRREVERRKLPLDSEDLDRLLRQAMLGLPPMSRATAAQIATLPKDPDEIDARLVARYGIAAIHLRRVAQDLSEHGSLARDLLAKTPEAKIRGSWEDAQTCIRVETYRVPRVPTSQEIERAVINRQRDIKVYFGENQRLFSRPARVFLRRFRALVPKSATANDTAEARAKVVQARLRVEGGEDLEALVRKEGAEQDRRSGGRYTAKKSQKPDLYDKEVGHITQIERTQFGWVFYQVEGSAPELKRVLSDSRVQREIGAALLRRDDHLPSASRTTSELIKKLRTERSKPPAASWLKAKRIRSAETKRFCRTNLQRVPTIGLAPEFARAVFGLTTENPVSTQLTVRQDYVVARLLERSTPTDAQWDKTKDAYTESWRSAKGPLIVKEWLNEYLKTVTLGLAIERLNTMTMAELTGD